MSEARWLVTGASGFLGRHLLEANQAGPHPHPVSALVRDETSWKAQGWTAPLGTVTPLAGSVLNPGDWRAHPGLDGLSGIFHLAALVRHSERDAAQVFATNVQGTIHLVRLAAERHCRMVFVSTSGTVGCFARPGESADEASPFCETMVARWPYYRSKLEAERQARALATELGVELVIVRPPVLLGPGDHRFRSSEHVLRLLEGKVPFVIRGGMHFADVRDVAQALIRIMELPEPRPVYHLPGTVSSIAEFYNAVARLAGRKPPGFVLPAGLARAVARLSQALGFSRLPDPLLIEMASHYWSMRSRYAESELGYRSRPGDETISDTIAWLRTHHPELA